MKINVIAVESREYGSLKINESIPLSGDVWTARLSDIYGSSMEYGTAMLVLIYSTLWTLSTSSSRCSQQNLNNNN